MRDDIISDFNGAEKTIDIYKAIGKYYGNFWFTNNHCRYRFLKGSRSSKKSKVTGYEIILKMITDDRRNILVCRQNYSDLRGSSFEGIVGCIYDLGLEGYFSWTTQPLEITYKGGNKCVFRGLNNPTSLNSLTFAHGFLTDCYIEEAYEVANFQDFIKLDGSLRGKLPQGLYHQITCLFNAWSGETWLYHEFYKNRLEDDWEYLETHKISEYINEDYIGSYGRGLYLATLTYQVNEFRDAENYDRAMEEMKKNDFDRWKTEAMGCWGSSSAATYTAFNDTCIKPIQDLLKENYIEFALGIDTGLSTAEGAKRTVKKGEDPTLKVRAATTMCLIGITSGYSDINIIDEYYHTNDRTCFHYNTDKNFHPGEMTQPELISYLVQVIIDWMHKYEAYPNKPRGSNLMTGNINVYVDGADLGTRQLLELEARKRGLYNVRFFGGSKLSIQSRVDFENALQHMGNWHVNGECKNTIREFKNARRGERGEARTDTDDHVLTCIEYAYTPYWMDLIARHNFKPH